MSRTGTLWLSEYERIGEDFAAGKMDEGEFINRMTHLGFDSDEIADHIIAVEDGVEPRRSRSTRTITKLES